MRKLLVLAAFAALSTHVFAQPPAQPEGSNWQHVQALPPGTSIHVKAQHGSASCALKSVDADSLSCTSAKDLSFQRTEIKSITIPRRGASAAVMAGIGAGVGAGIAKAGASATNAYGGGKNSVWAAGAGAGAAVFGLIGYATHPIHSTVYKAP